MNKTKDDMIEEDIKLYEALKRLYNKDASIDDMATKISNETGCSLKEAYEAIEDYKAFRELESKKGNCCCWILDEDWYLG